MKFKKGDKVTLVNIKGTLHVSVRDCIKKLIGKDAVIMYTNAKGELLTDFPGFNDWWFHDFNFEHANRGINAEEIISNAFGSNMHD